jgi:hypothetical protein
MEATDRSPLDLKGEDLKGEDLKGEDLKDFAASKGCKTSRSKDRSPAWF